MKLLHIYMRKSQCGKTEKGQRNKRLAKYAIVYVIAISHSIGMTS